MGFKKQVLKCKQCNDVYLTNPNSKEKGICRECENDICVGKTGKGFKYQWPWNEYHQLNGECGLEDP